MIRYHRHRPDALLTIRQTPPIDTGYDPRGFLQKSGEDACPRDMGESGSWTRVDDHITFGTGIDDIAIAPGTRETPTHKTQQTPWSH